MRSIGRGLWMCDEECNGNGSNEYNHSSLEDSDLQHLNQVLLFLFFECFFEVMGFGLWGEDVYSRIFNCSTSTKYTSSLPLHPTSVTTKN